MVSNINLMSSKSFLNICQKGYDQQLQDFIDQSNGFVDWTIYRHDPSGDTGLHLAAQKGHINIVKLLYHCSRNPESDINIMNLNGKRPLHNAAQFSQAEIVEFLIKKGALIDTFKKADWTPLMLACTKSGERAKQSIHLLLEANANPFLKNKDGWTAFFVACRTGDYDIVKFLLHKLGAKCIEDKSNNGRTILHICVFHGHPQIVDLLIQKYSFLLNIQDSVGYTPLHESIKCLNFEITKKLVSYGADVSQVDSSGRTVLHIAALCGNIAVLEYLLRENLIDVNIKDMFGNTAYAIAEKNNSGDVMQLLNKFATCK